MDELPLYIRIYNDILKQIYFGKLKKGDKVASRTQLCKRYQVSVNTVRQAMKLLRENGLIETYDRKAAVVVFDFDCPDTKALFQRIWSVRCEKTMDLYRVLMLILMPLVRCSMHKCDPDDVIRLEGIYGLMQTDRAHAGSFWEQSEQFIMYLLRKLGNDVICRLYESMVLSLLIPASQTGPDLLHDMRAELKNHFSEIIAMIKQGRSDMKSRTPGRLYVQMKDAISLLSSGSKDIGPFEPGVEPWDHLPCPIFYYRDCSYQRIYRDIFEQVLSGCYKLGDSLPTMDVLSKQYHVMPNTVHKAYKLLSSYDVVETVWGSGTSVCMDMQARVEKEMFSKPEASEGVRRCYETLQFFSLICGRIISYEAPLLSDADIANLQVKIYKLWDPQLLTHAQAPMELFSFIVSQTQSYNLRAIYQHLHRYFIWGKYLASCECLQAAHSYKELYKDCLMSVRILKHEGTQAFAENVSAIFVKCCTYMKDGMELMGMEVPS